MIQPVILSDEYLTSDLGQAAYLVACDVPLLRVDPGDRATFVFPGPARERAMLFFQPGRGVVEARKFHLALRDLRGLSRHR